MEVNQVDECLGGFFSYLKRRGLFDNSVVIVTSDHGDATGDFGRISHAMVIYPEVMHVPLIIHLPKSMQHKFVYDENELAALTDITPSLHFILGNHSLRHDPVFGHSLFAESAQELQSNARHELFMASDVAPVYGIMDADGKYLYATYASPAKSEFFDLVHDPNARKNIITPEIKQQYDQRIIDYLKIIGDFYGYKPGVSSFLASGR
jgi:arylsulfatase A-like enzyme